MSKFHQLQILENLKNIVTICYDYIDSNGKEGGLAGSSTLKKCIVSLYVQWGYEFISLCSLNFGKWIMIQLW